MTKGRTLNTMESMSLDNIAYKAHRAATYEEVQKRAKEILATIPAGKNRKAKSVALALLDSNERQDIKAFVLDNELLKDFDLEREYGIDPTPLFNLNRVTAEFREKVQSLYREEESNLEVHGDQLVEEIQEIRAQKLFGRGTEGKLAYIRNLLEISFGTILNDSAKRRVHLDTELRRIQHETLELLQRQKNRLGNSPKAEAVDSMIKKINSHVFRLELHGLAATHPACIWSIEELCRIYADEISQNLGEHLAENDPRVRYRKNEGIEVAYSSNNRNFLALGDVFGDCTAKEVRSQVDPDIANIHWTVYPWMLDPYYRVLETYVEGESVLKGHLTPLIIQGVPTLAIDAIEAVPKMRDIVKGRKNEYVSERLLLQRQEIINALLSTAKHIGDAMKVEQILVEKFSNAAWVREELDRLPVYFYHVNDVEKPFGTSVIQRLLSEILGERQNEEIFEEIQLVNVNLWSQDLRYGYKEVGVLLGKESQAKNIISGP